MSVLLIVDDEPNVLYSLKRSLETEELRVITAETAEAGIEALRRHAPDAVILDVRLPDMSGLDAFVEMREIDPDVPVVLVTAYSTTDTAIEAMKRGAFEYLLKPVEFEQLKEVVTRALEMRRAPALFEEIHAAEVERIVGRSPAMQQVYKSIGRVARQDLTVLITGESGTGKELVARAIHHHSRRAEGPFLAINCAALPESLLESELFGHERGAFTGADRMRVGKFEQVHGGTLFLDEIGDMSPATQAKVLRLLQEGTFERVGGNETLHADVRVIAATHRNLQHMVEEGEFREDLYYRLKVFAIEVPPLRRRMDDLPLLVKHFIATLGREIGMSVSSISPEAMRLLEQYDWPGNVRELQSAMKHALVHSVGKVITAEALPPSCRPAGSGGAGEAESPLDVTSIRGYIGRLLEENADDLYRKLHSEIDRILLPEVLNHVDGNQAQASELLGISRSTLRTRIADLGLTFEKRLKADSGRDD